MFEKFTDKYLNEANNPVYKKGQKVLIRLVHKGGVGKYSNAVSTSDNTEEARIVKRIKNKISGGYKYELSNFITVHPSEIVGLAESVNEDLSQKLNNELGSIQGTFAEEDIKASDAEFYDVKPGNYIKFYIEDVKNSTILKVKRIAKANGLKFAKDMDDMLLFKESVNEAKTYRLYMNSDADEPNEISYEEYFESGNKAAMIKKAKEYAKDKTNQYGDPIKIAVTADDDIDDVVWTNESVNEAKDKVDVASLSIGNTYKDNKGYPVKVIDIKGTGSRWKITYQYEDGKKKTVSTSLDKGINLYESINERLDFNKVFKSAKSKGLLLHYYGNTLPTKQIKKFLNANENQILIIDPNDIDKNKDLLAIYEYLEKNFVQTNSVDLGDHDLFFDSNLMVCQYIEYGLSVYAITDNSELNESINEALTIPTLVVMAIGAGLAGRMAFMSDEKLQKGIDTTKATAKAIIRELPIIGDRIKKKEFKEYQSAEIQKYLKDEISDQDIVDILQKNPKLKAAIKTIADGKQGYRDYYNVIRVLGGATSWGTAEKKFMTLRKKIKDGKIKVEEALNEDKMPDKYEGNDEIIFLKTKETSKGAHYNLYYNGHDIDVGGRMFKNRTELDQFAAEYILSNQLYNKLKYEKPKPLPESVDESVMSDIHLIAKEAKNEKDFVKKFLEEYGDKVKNDAETKKWLADMYKGAIEESVDESANDKFLQSAARNLAKQMRGKSASRTTLKNRLNSMPLANMIKNKEDLDKIVDYAMEEMGLKETLVLPVNEKPKGKGKSVTKQIWNKLSDDDKVDLLLTVFSDPDDAEDHMEDKWEELPDVATSNMVIYEARGRDIHKSTQFFNGVRADNGDLFYSKRHGLAIKNGDKLQGFYAWEGEPKLGKTFKTDKLHNHLGPATTDLIKQYYPNSKKHWDTEPSQMVDYAGSLMESHAYVEAIEYAMNENENRVYGMFTDDQGKPGKLDKELLDIALKGLPAKITKNIDAVEANGYGKSSHISPPTVSNKGQSRGEIEYHTISIGLLKPMGRNKITAITLGLRKRTSGPGTGYLFMKVAPDWRHTLGPDAQGAIEFWEDPSSFLQKLYNEKFKSWF